MTWKRTVSRWSQVIKSAEEKTRERRREGEGCEREREGDGRGMRGG